MTGNPILLRIQPDLDLGKSGPLNGHSSYGTN
jgi:hypothetical protein